MEAERNVLAFIMASGYINDLPAAYTREDTCMDKVKDFIFAFIMANTGEGQGARARTTQKYNYRH